MCKRGGGHLPGKFTPPRAVWFCSGALSVRKKEEWWERRREERSQLLRAAHAVSNRMSVATLALASSSLWETNRPLPPLTAHCQTSRADTGLLCLSLFLSISLSLSLSCEKATSDTPPLLPPCFPFLFCFWHSEGSCRWLVLRQNSGSQQWGPNPSTLHCPSPTQGGAAWHMDWRPGARISGAQNLLCCPVSCHSRGTSWIGGQPRSWLRLQLWDGVAERQKRARSARSVSYLRTTQWSTSRCLSKQWFASQVAFRLLQDRLLCCLIWYGIIIIHGLDLVNLHNYSRCHRFDIVDFRRCYYSMVKTFSCFTSEIHFRFSFVNQGKFTYFWMMYIVAGLVLQILSLIQLIPPVCERAAAAVLPWLLRSLICEMKHGDSFKGVVCGGDSATWETLVCSRAGQHTTPYLPDVVLRYK